MEALIPFILIIVFLFSFANLGPFSTRQPAAVNPEVVVQEKTIEKPITPATVISPLQQRPVLALIDTYITSGPENGEIIEDTNKVVFEFEAKILSDQVQGKTYFETKLIGFDSDWKKTSSKKRTITIALEPKEYTFLVRARTKNAIDYTPAQTTFKINVSPYFGKVKISKVLTETSSRPSLITLRISLKGEVSITGWQIRGKAGSFVIPQGIEKYHPGYNPVPKESIFVKQGDRIYLSGSLNPLGRGRNFRPNKCFGYLTEYRDFPISFSTNCPKPTREEISHLNPCCQEFIIKIRRCKIPDYSNNLKISLDSECVSYLSENFNYTSCFMDHSRDENFLDESWHIYMNSNILASNDCDTLYLRDQNGLIVDTYSYGKPVCR